MNSQAQASGQMGSANSLFVPDPTANWWPQELGVPTSTGSQNSLRYAYFANSHRLAVTTGGAEVVSGTTGSLVMAVEGGVVGSATGRESPPSPQLAASNSATATATTGTRWPRITTHLHPYHPLQAARPQEANDGYAGAQRVVLPFFRLGTSERLAVET